MNSARRIGLLCATLVLCATATFARDRRIVAVGDIHGEYKGLTSILQTAGIVDAKLRWNGGATHFVQTGDFLDRGADVRAVMDLLMRLEREAKRKRGEVTVLVGNHELMNLTGYLRDANPVSYSSFADKKSEKRRLDGYKKYLQLVERKSKRYGETFQPDSEAEWMEQHPLGFIEYQGAIGPNGKYGRWLRSKTAVAQLDGVIFLHGGLSPASSSRTIKEINDQVRLEMSAFDRIKAYLVNEGLLLDFSTLDELHKAVELELKARAARGETDKPDDLGRVISVARTITQWSIYQPDGPLWFRGYAYWNDQDGETLAADLLKAYRAEHVVVGHSVPPDPSGILPRFGGKIFLIDTAMLRGYVAGGRPSALEIASGRFTAIYANERVVLLDKRSPRSEARRGTVSRRNDVRLVALQSDPPHESSAVWLDSKGEALPFRSGGEIVEFLRTARVVSVNKKRLWGITKPQKVLVEKGRVRANAVFRSTHIAKENAYWEDGNFTEYLLDSYRADVAAYELGLLLGVENIPPTTLWKLKRREGALQIFLENARPATNKLPDTIRWARQIEIMQVFDALIHNLDRHPANMLIDSKGDLWLIDHTRSFGRETTLHNLAEIRGCDRVVWERLKTLRAETAREQLAPYLGPKEIDALLARRDELVRVIQAKIDAEGEERVLFTLDEPQPAIHPTRGAQRRGRNSSILLVAQQSAAPAAPQVEVQNRWLNPEGNPLPFTSDDEVIAFLQNGKMIKSFDIPEGVTEPRKVLLEWNGIQAHAVFRDVVVDKRNIRLADGKFYFFLRDDYRNEVAAYRLGKILGIDTIPPAVERQLFGKKGSIQIWIEKAMTEGKRKEKKLEPPDRSSWRRQLHTVLIFDNLVNNVDRNMGNMLVDPNWNVWMIDHTRTFGRDSKLPNPKRIARCPRRLWLRLTTVDDATIRAAMKPFMGKYEIDALLKRRRMILDLLKQRMATEGESKVLFGDDDELDEPVPSPEGAGILGLPSHGAPAA